jgi:hypothetical protein
MASATVNTVTVSFDPNAINIQTDVIFGATTTKAGAMTAAQVQQLNDATSSASTLDTRVTTLEGQVATTPIDIYVDPVTGNDNNNGSITAPFQTFRRAWNAQPAVWTQRCNIHLAAGTYPLNLTGQMLLTPGRNVGADSQRLTVIGTAVDSGLGTMVVTATAPTVAAPIVTTIDAAVSTTPGALRGAFYRNTVTGERAMITDNTTPSPGNTHFVLNGLVTIAIGNSFVIEKPGSILAMGNQGPVVFTNGIVNISDVKFSTAGGAFKSALLATLGGIVNYTACELLLSSTFRAFGANDGVHLAPSLAGLYVHANAIGSVFVNNQSSNKGSFIFDNCLVGGSAGGFQSYDSIFSNGTSYVIVGGFFEVDTGSIVGGGGFGGAQIILDETQALIGTNGFAQAVANAVNLSGSVAGTAGISVVGGSCTVGGVAGLNATYGIVAQNFAYITTSAARTTVTGTTNDVIAGTTASNYAGLPITDANTLTRINNDGTNA